MFSRVILRCIQHGYLIFLLPTGEEPTESLFMKELKRRGMTPTSLLEESWSTLKDENITYKEEDGGFSNRNAVSTDLEKSLLNQRERSISLNSEGLEVAIFLPSLSLYKMDFALTTSFKGDDVFGWGSFGDDVHL